MATSSHSTVALTPTVANPAQPLNPPPSRTRNLLVFVGKALVAALLVGWLVQSGHLDLGALKIFVELPWLFALDLALFMFGAGIATLRFRVLLGLADVRTPLGTIFRLQMTAFFFNVVIPGNIGGDVVKALYVARDAAPEKRTTVVLLAFVERLLGVSALVVMGALVTVARPEMWADPLLRPLAATVAALGATTLMGSAIAIAVVRRAGAKLDAYTSGPSKLSKLLNRLVASLRLVSAGPRNLLTAFGLSMTYHAFMMAFFTLLTQLLLQKDVPFTAVATIFPLGLLTMMLPISPSGLGVGHVAFKRLFEAIGLAGGATVFNVYLLGQMLFCLLGVFWFLGLRRQGQLPTEMPPETAADGS